MASIVKDPGGRRRIQFIAKDGKRKTVRLGKVSQEIANAVKVKMERLIAASKFGHPVDADTANWVAALDSEMAAKLAAVGLIPKREAFTLGKFIQAFIDARTDVKPSTRITYENAKRNLTEFFGEGRSLREITEGDAEDFRRKLAADGLAENTVRKRCAIAKQVFGDAIKRELIQRNPFRELKTTVKEVRGRFYFVTTQDAARVLEACPDAEWQLIFALARYGGLRTPSETLELRWSDIDWERERMTIRSPKTEHHDGKESRVVPIFPELRPYLDRVFEEPGSAEFVITNYRSNRKNFRTRMNRIIERAGLKPWPKTFQNLRSTRETELAEQYPLHVVCEWIGNSQPVAMRHYLQVTEAHMRQAAQKAAQQPGEDGRNGAKSNSSDLQKTADFQTVSAGCESSRESLVGREGLEPPTSAL